MEIQIGDKVRFLNQVGGGKVSGFKKGGLVLVEDEDGFEMPVLESEVVVVESVVQKAAEEAARKEAEQKTIIKEQKKEEEHEPTEEEIRIEQLKALYKKEHKAAQQNNARPALNPEHTIAAKATVSNSDSESLEDRIARLEITVRRLTTRLERLENAKTLREKTKSETLQRNEIITKSKNGILEIDLHAQELLDTTAGMDGKAIKEYQLQVVSDTMKRFCNEKGRRIVFIHGMGEGALRKAVIDLIHRQYPRVAYQDASFAEYGFGATMVTI